jgi:hypothetical protein
MKNNTHKIPMFNRLSAYGIRLLIFTSLLSLDAWAANFVTVKAWASEEYTKERALKKDKIQTYQFFKGSHFKGKSKDKGVEEISFNDLILDLAQHLVKQDYYPAPKLGEGDLLIVVHYGVTDFEVDQMELMGIDSLADISVTPREGIAIGSVESFDLMDALNSALGMQHTVNSGNSMTPAQKAQILGIDDIYDKPSHMTSDYEFEQMMREALYFVVLMAYDYQLRRKGESKLLWSTRYNIRSAGQSYETAIAQMNVVGSDYFGKSFSKLTRKRIDDKSNVEIGEIEVIENVSSDAEPN